MFPETQAIAHARAGTHKSKFMCAMYCTHKIIVFSLFVWLLYISHKEEFLIEGSFTEDYREEI